MKLATFTEGARGTRVGLVEDDRILDLSSASDVPADMVSLLALGAAGIEVARNASKAAKRIPLSSVRLEAPVLRPRKFLGLGGSYKSHLQEIQHLLDAPKHQTWFNKQVTCVNGPYDDIHLPRLSDTLDYEGELAIIIGATGRHIRGREAAKRLIAGFTVCNDFSVREWQVRAVTAMLGNPLTHMAQLVHGS